MEHLNTVCNKAKPEVTCSNGKLFRWNKKYFSQYFKGYHLVKKADTSFKCASLFMKIDLIIKFRNFNFLYLQGPMCWNPNSPNVFNVFIFNRSNCFQFLGFKNIPFWGVPCLRMYPTVLFQKDPFYV